jgi:hypothetical protein
VIGVPDPQWSEAIKAVCVLQPSKRATAEEIIDFVGDLIARYKRPKIVVFVDKFPKGRGGDVDRLLSRRRMGGRKGLQWLVLLDGVDGELGWSSCPTTRKSCVKPAWTRMLFNNTPNQSPSDPCPAIGPANRFTLRLDESFEPGP